MKVIQIQHPHTQIACFRVYGDDNLPVSLINTYLIFLENKGLSPNSIRAYAYDLKAYLSYLLLINKDWIDIGIEDIVNFVQYLKHSSSRNNPDILPVNGIQARSSNTINRTMTAVNGFYKFQYARQNRPIPNIEEFITNPYTASEKPLLSFARASRPRAMRRAVRPIGRQTQKTPSKPKEIDSGTQKAILNACCNRRDRLLILLLIETGMRIGQALSLRHSDIESWDQRIKIEHRNISVNDVYSKSKNTFHVHISENWIDLLTNYLVLDLGDVDSDHLFTNLYSPIPDSKEIPLRYSAVKSLFMRLSRKVGKKVTPHMFRHTHATELLRAGMSMELVAKRLGHKSIETTKTIYEHLNAEDMRKELAEHLNNNEFLKSLYKGI